MRICRVSGAGTRSGVRIYHVSDGHALKRARYRACVFTTCLAGTHSGGHALGLPRVLWKSDRPGASQSAGRPTCGKYACSIACPPECVLSGHVADTRAQPQHNGEDHAHTPHPSQLKLQRVNAQASLQASHTTGTTTTTHTATPTRRRPPRSQTTQPSHKHWHQTHHQQATKQAATPDNTTTKTGTHSGGHPFRRARTRACVFTTCRAGTHSGGHAFGRAYLPRVWRARTQAGTRSGVRIYHVSSGHALKRVRAQACAFTTCLAGTHSGGYALGRAYFNERRPFLEVFQWYTDVVREE